jgi:hypothetical protein
MPAFDLPRFKRWFGTPPFVNEQDENEFDKYVLSFKTYLDPMDSLIAKLVYEYALERYKAIQLLNMSGGFVKQQASQLEHLEQAAAQDQEEFDRKGDPERDSAHIIREFSAHSSVYWCLPVDSASDFSDKSIRKGGDVDIALRFEASLHTQIKIDAAINECMRRAKGLFRHIQALSNDLAQRLDHDFWMRVLDER